MTNEMISAKMELKELVDVFSNLADVKDAKVDENAFDKRVEELSGDPYIRNLGAGLTVPKNKQILKKPAEEKDEPEKFFAIDLYRSYQKNLEKQKNIKKPEQAPTEPEEEIKQSGEGVPVV